MIIGQRNGELTMLIIILDLCKNWFKDYVYDNKNGKCLK